MLGILYKKHGFGDGPVVPGVIFRMLAAEVTQLFVIYSGILLGHIIRITRARV